MTTMDKEETDDGSWVGGGTGKRSPELKASIPSILTFQWVQPLIRTGNIKPLEAEDLYDLIPKESTLQCEKNWLQAIDNERRKKIRRSRKEGNAETLSVWRLLYGSMGNEFMLGGICKPIWLVAVVLQVYVLRALVRIVQTSDTETLHWWWATILVLAMLVTSTTQSITQHLCFTLGQKIGMRARATVAMAVFNKLQAMRLVSLVSTNTGIMLNLVTNDTQKILDAAQFFHFVWFGVVEVTVLGGLVIYESGISGIPGVVIIFLTQPLQVKLAQLVGKLRRTAIQYTDSRVRSVNEILTGVRVVKYNGWTAAFLKRIGDLRATEISWIRKASYFRASTSTLRDGITPLASLVTFGTYVAIHGGAALTPSLAFTLLALFSILVRMLSIAPLGVQYASEAMVAIQRLQRLLDLPNGTGSTTAIETDEVSATNGVFISNGVFSWTLKNVYPSGKDKIGALIDSGNSHPDRILKTPVHTSLGLESEEKKIEAATLKEINFEVKRGELVAIVGPVGSGKSSLLLALLGEMECLSGVFRAERSVAYAPQQPWILNDTIRSNILFGNKYDEVRYKQTVTACALDHDIAQLPAGHDTEIGERGVNLSGGQKARISLARACYSTCPVVLLDDPLAAVDVPTAKHLMDHVLAGIVKDRTVILVTHNKTSLTLCDRIYVMEHGTLEELAKEALLEGKIDADIFHEAKLSEDQSLFYDGGELSVVEIRSDPFQKETSHGEELGNIGRGIGHKETTANDNLDHAQKEPGIVEDRGVSESVDKDKAHNLAPSDGDGHVEKIGSVSKTCDRTLIEGGKLTVKEDRVEGVVTWGTYIKYAKDGGGLAFFILVMLFFVFAQAVRVMVDYWLSIWVDGKYHLSTKLYVIAYACFAGGAIILSLSRALIFTKAAILAAKQMHGRMAERVLRSPQSFFDQNPIGRIVNRFSKDQALVDELLPSTAQTCLENFVGCLGSIAIMAVLIPWFLLCMPPFLLVFMYLQRHYVVASRELKRLDGVSRSPMYAHFSQTLQGVASVRAFGAEGRMHDQFITMIDANHRAYILFVHASRWLGIRLDFAATVCVATASLLVVILRHKLGPGLAGVVLVQSLQLTGFFQYGVRLAADTENYFTSVERIQGYSELPSEADPHTKSGVIAEEWPQKGEIEFVNYTMAYREDLHPVLVDLCFKVRAQEKVGILGRTGAGKSSLAAALFRMVENRACSGSILIDEIDITRVGLDDLRQRLSIIPQDPVLFRGTVRLNLDPFEHHTDAEINEAIAKVHLSKKIQSLERGIDSIVSENGENFSVGQRQLLCLARSLLRRSRVIVMDEATAAVDGETDQLIQTAMRIVFHGCTVLTIAHRIDTIIDCDRVLILAKGGRVAEFDTPANLLRRAENLATSSQEARTQHNGDGDYGFAHIVAQSGAVLAKQLRESAEAAELQRKKNVD